MPLPPALLARLQKRGIVEEGPLEEVIAESYDDESGNKGVSQSSKTSSGAPGCPNKWNPYHLCVDYCWDQWGDGTPEERLAPEYDKKRARMLRKYPLPANWKEVYDAGVARHYYWNQETDEVCWLSPVHPKAVIGEAAPKVAKVTFDKIEKAKHDRLMKETAAEEEPVGRGSRRRRQRPPTPQPRSSDEEADEGNTGDKRKKSRRKPRNDLDPMDPASYGECEVGKWSSGLDTRGEATTGADTTASGPLFQMRPYPSPGAILKKNANLKK